MSGPLDELREQLHDVYAQTEVFLNEAMELDPRGDAFVHWAGVVAALDKWDKLARTRFMTKRRMELVPRVGDAAIRALAERLVDAEKRATRYKWQRDDVLGTLCQYEPGLDRAEAEAQLDRRYEREARHEHHLPGCDCEFCK